MRKKLRLVLALSIIIICVAIAYVYIQWAENRNQPIQPVYIETVQSQLRDYEVVKPVVDKVEYSIAMDGKVLQIPLIEGERTFTLNGSRYAIKTFEVLGLTRYEETLIAFVHYVITPLDAESGSNSGGKSSDGRLSVPVTHYIASIKIGTNSAQHVSSLRIGNRVTIASFDYPMYASEPFPITVVYTTQQNSNGIITDLDSQRTVLVENGVFK
jgi:hypothetical protein